MVWQVLANFLQSISFIRIAKITGTMIPRVINAMLYKTVLRIMIQVLSVANRNLKFSNPTHSLDKRLLIKPLPSMRYCLNGIMIPNIGRYMKMTYQTNVGSANIVNSISSRVNVSLFFFG